MALLAAYWLMTPPHGSGDNQRVDEPDSSLAVAISDITSRSSGVSDKARFSEVFRVIAPRLKSLTMAHGVSAEVSEEVAIETMVKVWRRASEFDAQTSTVAAWIYSILAEQCRQSGIDLAAGGRTRSFNVRSPLNVELTSPLSQERTSLAAPDD